MGVARVMINIPAGSAATVLRELASLCDESRVLVTSVRTDNHKSTERGFYGSIAIEWRGSPGSPVWDNIEVRTEDGNCPLHPLRPRVPEPNCWPCHVAEVEAGGGEGAPA